MTTLPENIPIASARLPVAYEAARTALANCASIDECQDWANKADALASYAKQADDNTLRRHAERIQARAVRRCGELLKQFDGRGGDRSKNDATVNFAPTQKQAADDAGLSERQRVTAVRVANVPEPDFEAAVDSEAPPTVSKLADMGRVPRETKPEPAPAPPGFVRATELIGTVKDFAKFCRHNDPSVMAGAVYPHEVAQMRRDVSIIDAWMDRFIINLPE